ncbi:MAG: MotA/TolQ/ExbB proton channel family protein [Bacteroidales bacterium]|nr:MotA/TolQ/ExbB proton channel family protein [Bacteroidales bacterium]
MKKVIALLSIAGLLAFSNFNGLKAQEQTTAAEATEQTTDTTAATVDTTAAEEAATTEMVATEKTTDEVAPLTFHQVLKQKYIQGGAGWMTPILMCLLFGLALVIERVLYLNLATTNVEKLLASIEENVKKGDYNAAKEVCRNTRGPVASIFYQGLDRIDEGLENVEKAITSYGGVQMGRLESNLSWIALFIAIAPMFGFLGTVIGMVQAFDDIEKAGDISPTVVAGGMKVALITTVFGLICGLILQICYNYLISKIEGLVNTMEDSSITFMDILIKNRK